jgi:transcription initiation factor IIE alpha subunit
VQKHKSKKAEQELLAPHVISKILTTVPRGREVLEFLIERPFITFDILEAELNITSSETKGIVRKLTQLGLVEFDAHKRYVRTPYFNSIVRENYDAIVNTLKEKIYEEQIEHKKIEI